jgi:DNA mismatch repair protein MutS2
MTHRDSVDNQQLLRKLEFTDVLQRLATYCHYSVAAQRASEIGPSGDRKIVSYLLDVTSEAADLLTYFPEVTIGGARDIREYVERAERGGRLQPAELLLVADTLISGRELKKLFTRLPDAESRFPNLLEFARDIANFTSLETDLNRAIGPRGDVLDTASEELGRIRRAIRVAHSRLMDRLNGMIGGSRFGSALQENLITIRDGRYVLPVRSEARGVVRGIVHDTSASGQTLFIEPFDIVELNNRWREQQMLESREVERILDMLSARIGDASADINRMVEAIAAIDLAMAKARLAAAMQATRPTVYQPPVNAGRDADAPGHPTAYIRLDQARHPLLNQETVVPTSIELGRDFRVLLITGPNTGGKTVVLKTIGLLTLMAQTGLFIPADDTSVISVFGAVYVDIGDEQSIEQSLSTFSSHMQNIIAMLRHVGSDSLVLLDELGAGTDPLEGSALARALIDTLLQRKAMVVATTHYPEVKAYAYATRGVENGSVEFDVATLAPTYRLTVGIPGRSNALAIASRLGMPREIVEHARTLLEPGDERAESLIDDIRTRRDEIAAQLEHVQQTGEEARTLRRRAAQALREAEEQRRDARAEATAQIERELAAARAALRDAERLRVRAAVPVEEIQQTQRTIREVEDRVRTISKPAPRPVAEHDRQTFRTGDRVRSLTLELDGEVLSVDGDEAEIALGSLKLRQPLGDLRRLGRARRSESDEPRVQHAQPDAVSIEIDVRGQRAEEVTPVVESYLHDAYLTGLPWVRIIHGKGTGALRNVVRELLRDNPVVLRSESAKSNEGGEGATVAWLRQG